MSILVIDVGTSSVRAAIVEADGTISLTRRRRTPPDVPLVGLVEFDPAVIAGFVAVIGDTVVDGSARHRLELRRFQAPPRPRHL